MSIISKLLYKIRVALLGGHDYDIIYDTDDEYDIPHTPNKDVQSYLDYPSKPTGITLFSEREILSVHASRIQEINMYIGLPNSDLSDSAYTLTNLVIKPLMEYTRWIHLLPASENHHHAGTGGLLTHSLETAFLALKFAYSTELPPISLQDEEQIRKRRYLYAAFICGLFHDAGKIFDVDVISSTHGVESTWRPLSSSLMDWANTNRILSYEVIWRKRVGNEHSIRAPVFLERCLNDTCLNYLSDVVKERLYDKMLSALGNYKTSNDFISRCMRTADWHSTGTDTSYRYDKQSGLRASDTAARAMSILKDNISSLNINGFDSSSTPKGKGANDAIHIMIIGSSVYINEHTALDFILSQFKQLGINFPDGEIGRKSLTDLLLSGGYIEPYGEQRTAHFFHQGEFSGSDIHRMFNEGIKGLSWYPLLKIKWVGFLFRYDVLPESTPGIFSIHDTNDYVYVDRKGNDTLYVRPLSQGMKTIRLGNQGLMSPQVMVEKEEQHISQNCDAETEEGAHSQMSSSSEVINHESKEKLLAENTGSFVHGHDASESEHEVNASQNTPKKKNKKKKIVPQEDVVKILQHKVTSNAIPESELALIDGVLFVSEGFVRSFGTVNNDILMESGLFVLSLRNGSLDEELSVPAKDGIRYLQLDNEIALTQLRHQPNVKQTELLPLLSADLFGGVTSSVELSDSLSLTVMGNDVQPEPLPAERYDENSPVVSESEPETSGFIPVHLQDQSFDENDFAWEAYERYVQPGSLSDEGHSNPSTPSANELSDVVSSPQCIEFLSDADTAGLPLCAVESEQTMDECENESDKPDDLNSGFEALFASQKNIVTDPSVVIAQANVNQDTPLSFPSNVEQTEEEKAVLSHDLDEIITLLNRIRLNENTSFSAELTRISVVFEGCLYLRVKLTDNDTRLGLSEADKSRLVDSVQRFDIVPVKVMRGHPVRHYCIRLDDLRIASRRNNIFFDDFIASFKTLESN
jgi:conjugal transfer pilus assembly protein TraI